MYQQSLHDDIVGTLQLIIDEFEEENHVNSRLKSFYHRILRPPPPSDDGKKKRKLLVVVFVPFPLFSSALLDEDDDY